MGEKNHMNLKDMHQLKQMLRMDLKIMGETKIGLNLDIDIESSKTFSNNSLKIFRAFQNIASSFYTMREYNHLQNSFTKELISSLIKLLEMHDIYTKGHSENVAKLASKLAKKMGLSQKIINDTYWTGMVHDMGKILIPIELLNKSEKLTEEEYELIKEHPVLGSQALENSDSLKHISEYVRYHHERWDGKGYPDGLSGYEIPIVAQIIQVADSWDAMRSKRVYKRALSFEEAFEEIKINRGRQFAPRAAHHFLEMLNNYEVYSDVLDEYDF